MTAKPPQDSRSLHDAVQSTDWKSFGNLSLFLAVHLACFVAIWTGVRMSDLLVCLALYLVRMFAITAGYHRYFSHRTYKMGRVMQLVMAFVAMTSSQKGVLWWAAHHRRHHKYSDKPDDVHSPVQRGLWWSHVGWILASSSSDTDSSLIKDLIKYPELRWLNRHVVFPVFCMGAFSFFCFNGLSTLIVGFFWSTVLVWHATFTINSLSHVIGSRRYDTDDASRNNWFLALITLGEGWHNNHHHYMNSCRQGFFWWEYDFTYYGLKVLSWFGLVWDLREPPRWVLEGHKRRPSKSAPEKPQPRQLTEAA